MDLNGLAPIFIKLEFVLIYLNQTKSNNQQPNHNQQITNVTQSH